LSEKNTPIVLNFHALSHGGQSLGLGQLTRSNFQDLSFLDYSSRRTFRTLFKLYRTKAYVNQPIELVFGGEKIKTKTDKFGSFMVKTETDLTGQRLERVRLSSGKEARLMEGLYSAEVASIDSQTIIVSDIDDTLLHSYIMRKALKFRTLMFTTMEKRKAVTEMKDLLQSCVTKGASCFYLSNSEQNLYPLIYRFLTFNEFPAGPLILKKWRRLWQVLWNIKFPIKNVHKQQTLIDLFDFFPDKQFVLMGDNTQHDLPIYLEAATQYPRQVSHIIIRKVVTREEDEAMIAEHREKLIETDVKIHYGDDFPNPFEF